MKNTRMVFLLPLGLGLAGIALLIRIVLFDNNFFLPRNFDLIILLIGISLSTFAAVNWIIQEGLEYLREQSITQARKEAFAEHQRFLRRLDHELKNPLTAIQAGVQTLTLSSTDEDHSQVLQAVELETRRLSRLVTDLRKLAELQSLPLEKIPVSIQQLSKEIVLLEQERIEEQCRKFSITVPDNLPSILGDPELLLLATHNIFDNALKYSHPGDSISLCAHAGEGFVSIKISDTGMGINPEEVTLVWEELYRGKNSQGIPGYGIGLTLVQSIIQLHHGWVNLQSQPGQGTAVTLWLPHL